MQLLAVQQPGCTRQLQAAQDGKWFQRRQGQVRQTAGQLQHQRFDACMSNKH